MLLLWAANLVSKNETAILDSTAHALKFSNFQQMYFDNCFPPQYNVVPDPELVNAPQLVTVKETTVKNIREKQGKAELIKETAREIARRLQLTNI